MSKEKSTERKEKVAKKPKGRSYYVPSANNGNGGSVYATSLQEAKDKLAKLNPSSNE